jgi:hypothetical protein
MSLDLDKVVAYLSEGFQVLANEGLIHQDRVKERARNQAVVVQLLISEETDKANMRVDHLAELSKVGKELTDLQVARAEANAMAYTKATEEIDGLRRLADHEQSNRRALHAECEKLRRQLKEAVKVQENLRGILANERAEETGREDASNGAIANLEKSLDMLTKAAEVTKEERLKLEDKLIAIVESFDPRPF